VAENHVPQFIDVEVRGKSFLYNQIRRMVGLLVYIGTDAAANHLQRNSLFAKRFLDSRTPDSRVITTAPAHGLYLQKVLYEEEVDNDKAML
jgi:tRNA U38,U39,U40 pseudouridine synthase TruA